MRINNFIAKTHSKLRLFLRKYFGNNNKSIKLIKFFISMIISSDYFYYISDRGYPKIIVFFILTGIIYLILSLFVGISKYLVEIVKRINTKNIIVFIILINVIYSALIKCKKDAIMTDLNIKFITILLAIVIVIFSKTLYSYFKNKKKVALPFFILTSIAMFSVVAFLFYPGKSEKSALKYADIGTLSLETPAQFSSKSIEYGNENPKEISLLSYVSYSGKKKAIRDKYFNKTLAEVPLKGRVWYPENKKNSPVLFIAHGNHRFTEENYKGYDYLGRYLARRGYVVVSIDMNMLNGFMKYGLSGENDARAILLLENINEILNKNKQLNSKMYNLIDENNIVIAGHSRGGEAVAIAHNYNKLDYNPDNGNKYNYNFNIKGVISISPTFDQYKPSGKEVKLEDTNYLVLHGTHDKDVTGFQGMNIYNNTSFKGNTDHFKAAVYIAYANHGQFNSRWKNKDTDPPQSLILNTKSLIDEEEQEEILCKYTHEFLENTFGFSNDRGLFINPINYELPKTLYYSRYSDSTFNNLVDFEEDYDITTSKSGSIDFKNIRISEEKMDIGGFTTNNTIVKLKNNSNGKYKIKFDILQDAKNYLQFDIKLNQNEEDYKEVDLYIELKDYYGNTSKININDYYDNKVDLYPDVKVELSKLQDFTKSYKYKGSLQTVRIPIDDFIMRSKLVRTDINEIKFEFAGNNSNTVTLDNIGFSN